MEGYFILLGLAISVLFVYWSARNDKRDPGQPVIGIFAYRAGREPKLPQTSKTVGGTGGDLSKRSSR